MFLGIVRDVNQTFIVTWPKFRTVPFSGGERKAGKISQKNDKVMDKSINRVLPI